MARKAVAPAKVEPVRRKRTPLAEETHEVEDATLTPPPPDPIVSAEVEAVSQLMDELAGVSSAYVTVYRANRNQKQTYLFKCSADAFSLDNLRDSYGGGEFRLYITREGQLWKNLTVSVEPKAGVIAPAIPGQTMQQQSLADVMREGFAAQSQMIADVLASRSAAPAALDLPAIITSITGVITTLRPLLAPPPVAAGLDAEKIITLVMKGAELQRDMGSGGGSDNPLLDMMRDVIKTLPAITAAIQTAPQVRQMGAPVKQPLVDPRLNQHLPQPMIATPLGPAPAPVVESTSAAEPEGLSKYLALLCSFAAAGKTPDVYASLILDQAPDAEVISLLEAQPSPIDHLIAQHADVANHREWFERVIAIVAEAFTDDDIQDAQQAQSGIPSGNHVDGPDSPVLQPPNVSVDSHPAVNAARRSAPASTGKPSTG